MRVFCVFILACAGAFTPAAGQRAYHATWADGVSLGAASVLTVLPEALRLPKGAPDCAPCDPATLWGLDRRALGARSAAAGTASDAGALGVLGLGGLALVWHRRPSDARGDAMAYADAVGWSAVAVQWLKVTIGRERPVMYTSGAVAAAADADNQRSFPSSHATVAFSAATAYLVISGREHLAHRTRTALLLYGGALATGVLRVEAGQHFPTDVLAGAALGSGLGWLAATLHR
ncbi:MAG TPA: phosphatase PAP2 family protein [Gemmatimonadales bacterium]